ncbi:MAG TPA: hypothetical protein VF658_01495 [Pyrinomonadaceae bacterium]
MSIIGDLLKLRFISALFGERSLLSEEAPAIPKATMKGGLINLTRANLHSNQAGENMKENKDLEHIARALSDALALAAILSSG